ncbi:aminotransferase class I/II-fold pyridoxal phosphate-dependent enzyme [Spiribacter sp. 2438]|uniref:pyridoxal phosphate-dependent aminotransferase n=1 Tax=Spiribacter sp. 2438 TaxID=2666185 RepID=UPI0012AFE433|nr:pyridoxal phosphate-dependent aminotransferase [Spiribacter sp. 2438]QGM21435.1 aminotransferase class I/II-fold pyridoxal phosphate-dependent enzyme [Spiribacter sp. 2438]
MDIQLAGRVQRVKPSPTMAVTARAAEMRAAGHDIIGLGAGEPDFDTPQHISEAAIQAIRSGQTRYTPVDGTPALKQAIQAKFERDSGLHYEGNQILVSSGAKQSLYNLFTALLNEGDEVVIPAPFWVSYPDMVLLADGVPRIVEADQTQRFKITPEQLANAITERTRAVVLNSPSNPTGSAYSRAELQALGEVLRGHPDIVIVSDDIYEHILWTEEGFSNIAMACPDLADRTVLVNGVSKAYAMTGWRIGYAAGPAPLIGAMKKIQSQSTSNPSSISQAASVAALDGDQGVIEPMLKAFRERHDYVVERLNAMQGVSCIAGDGTFYAYPDVSGAMKALDAVDTDTELAEYLIGEANVALVPGTAFGLSGHARISYATSMENLEKAMDRLEGVFGRD